MQPKTCKMTKDGEVRDMPLHFDHSHQCYLDRGWKDVEGDAPKPETDPPDAGPKKDQKPAAKPKGKQLPLDEGT